MRQAVVLVCGGEGVTAGELASREGIMLLQRQDGVVVDGWAHLMIQTSALRIWQCVTESLTGRCGLGFCDVSHFSVQKMKAAINIYYHHHSYFGEGVNPSFNL